MDLLRLGNSKLGQGIYHFGIPAIETCPDRSGACAGACYATRGRYHCTSVRDHLARNLAASREPSFVAAMASEVRRRMPRVVRWHSAGDLYSVVYARKCLEIFRSCRHTIWLMYTRGWRSRKLLPPLRDMASLPNVRLWLSCDRETGPARKFPGVRGRAYLSLDDSDWPDFPVELVFRARDHTPAKFSPGGALVCPVEQGVERRVEITCSTCKYCFAREPIRRPPRGRRRLALPITT